MKSEILKQIVDLLTPLVLAIFGYLSIKVTKYIDSKLKNQEDKDFAEKIQSVATDVVKSVYQTYISKQKGTTTLEPEVAAKAKEMAMNQIKDHLGDELSKKLGDDKVDSVISTKVEAAVYDMKKAISPLLILILCLPLMACGVKATTVATTTLDTQRSIVTTLDKSANLWYTFRRSECTNKALDAKKKFLDNPSASVEDTEHAATRAAYATYDSCMKMPNVVIDKIIAAVNLARRENKIAAQAVLDAIRGKTLVSTLGDVTTPVVQLVIDIKKIMDDNGIVMTSYE